MAGLKYTKGEWKVEKWYERHGFNVLSETNSFVASVPMNVGLEHTMIEAQANAHLISASPDNYNLVVEMLEETLFGELPRKEFLLKWRDKAVLTRWKAEGKKGE